jgi:hypothetical protein
MKTPAARLGNRAPRRRTSIETKPMKMKSAPLHLSSLTLGVFAAVALIAAAPTQTEAALIAYDGFDYTADTNLAGSNGGTGWSGAWSGGSHKVTTNSLTYGSLQTSGQRVSLQGQATFSEPNRAFGSAPATGHLFVSWVNDATNGTNFNTLRLQNGSNRAVVVGNHFNEGSGGNWSIYSGGASFTNLAVSSKPVSGIQLVVVDLDLDTNTANLYIDPASLSGGAPATPDATFTFGSSLFTNTLQFGQGANAGGGAGFDELRVGTTFADVTPVPEPAALVSLTGGAALLGMLRRRRSA